MDKEKDVEHNQSDENKDDNLYSESIENKSEYLNEESNDDSSSKGISNKGGFIKNKKVILGICVSVALILGILADSVSSKYKNVVYPGAKLYENNISKLDKDSLNNEIDKIKDNIGRSKIKVKTKNNSYEIEYNDLVKAYNEEELSTEVMSYGKDRNILQKFGIITIGKNRNYKFDVVIDENSINDVVNKIYDENSKSSVEPHVEIDGNSVNIKEGKKGVVVNKEKLSKEIKNTIDSYKVDIMKDIDVEYIEEDFKISIEDLKKVDKKISSYSTQYGTGGGRGKNIEVATSKLDNLLLMPGEEFSYENTVGPVTQANGYTYAPVISNGNLVQGIGGGLCQVSSTVYNAELRAGILPTERRNHSKAVSYVPRGLDATLASGSIDYKFKNTYDYPLVINTYTSGGRIYIEFWSNKNATKGITYEAVGYANGKVANTYLYGYDSNKNRVYEKHIDTSVYR